MPFFSGLLPDGELRRRIANALHVSETSSLRLLEALGGECAGTVHLRPEPADADQSAPEDEHGYVALPLPELERMIGESERLPLLVHRRRVRLSLAGAQDKIPLLRRDGEWYLPTGSAPTTHILKPASVAFPGIVHNEYAVMRLAGFLSRSVPEVELARIGKPVLIVRRYDRRHGDDGTLERIHQEDFCQALGIMPDRKYQSDGGPGFKEMASLIREACSTPLDDLERLVDAALYAVLVGNCDAHGKNYSILYADGSVGLAPLYDLVSTAFWPDLDTALSMRFGMTHRLPDLGPDDLAGFAKDLNVAPRAVQRRLDRLREIAPDAWDRLLGLPELSSETSIMESIRAGWEERMRWLHGESR